MPLLPLLSLLAPLAAPISQGPPPPVGVSLTGHLSGVDGARARVLFAPARWGADRALQRADAVGRGDDGYRGIWYANQASGDEYVYKYSGGLGTYCAKHAPFAIHVPEVGRTYFCYGGAPADDPRRLLHMVSYFDHATGTVPRPTRLLDKKTSDAHDNPVLSIDDEGHLWVFSTSHGRARPSFVHRSVEPHSIRAFERVDATYEKEDGTRAPLDNFSYMQAWRVPGRGFACFFTRYGDPAKRTNMFMTSADGVRWSRWQRLAAIDEGHYQISGVHGERVAAAFNYHPEGRGLNWRTNLYYLQSDDLGATWTTAGGAEVAVPVTEVASPALVHDYAAEGLLVYLKDLRFDSQGRPILVYVTSGGYEAGPKNGPRTWTTARWTGERWDVRPITTSDNNYDHGSLVLVSDRRWRLVAPTEPGPQRFNPGGEVAVWETRDAGATWSRAAQLTSASAGNHTYVRRVLGADDGFVALWADGDARRPSASTLHLCDAEGRVYELPRKMKGEAASPAVVPRLPLVSDLKFAGPEALAQLALTDADAWRVDGAGALEQHRQSEYAPPHRSPRNLALLRTPVVGSFVLELEVQQTGREYSHRDMSFVFGYQDPARFLYAHVASGADATAHHVHVVDGADRRPITTSRTEGADWSSRDWHLVRIERDVEARTVEVRFDGEVVLTAEAADFPHGRVGFGTFDDTCRVRRLRLWSLEVEDPSPFTGFR